MQSARWLGNVACFAALFLGVMRLAAGCTTTTNERSSASPSPSETDSSADSSITLAPTTVGTIELDIATGSDSVRLDSTVSATINYMGGATETIDLPLHGTSLDGGSVINFTQGSTSTVISDIHYLAAIENIDIALVSHPIPNVETDDSWSVSDVRVSVTYTGGTSTCVLDQPGMTVTDGQTLVLNPGGCAAAGTMELLIVTGNDGLRYDSTASVTVKYEGGASNVVPLTQSFLPGTTIGVSVGLVSSQPIASLAIAMQSHPDDVESADNWAISQVEALIVTEDGGAPTCIINALGENLTDGLTLTVVPGGCPSTDGDAGAEGGSDAAAD